METFYFVREPDHMIECSNTLPPRTNIPRIKTKHKIFNNLEDAIKWQKIIGTYDDKTAYQLNIQFIKDGMGSMYGYWSEAKK